MQETTDSRCQKNFYPSNSRVTKGAPHWAPQIIQSRETFIWCLNCQWRYAEHSYIRNLYLWMVFSFCSSLAYASCQDLRVIVISEWLFVLQSPALLIDWCVTVTFMYANFHGLTSALQEFLVCCNCRMFYLSWSFEHEDIHTMINHFLSYILCITFFSSLRLKWESWTDFIAPSSMGFYIMRLKLLRREQVQSYISV